MTSLHVICSLDPIPMKNPGYAYDDNSPPASQFLRDNILLKKNHLGEMLIEQIIEFELRGPVSLGPRAVYVLLQLVIFMTKQNFSRNLFE